MQPCSHNNLALLEILTVTKVKQRQHCSAECSPVLFVTSFLIVTKYIITNHSKERHQHRQENYHIEHRIAYGVNQSHDEDLETLNEGYGTQCTSNWKTSFWVKVSQLCALLSWLVLQGVELLNLAWKFFFLYAHHVVVPREHFLLSEILSSGHGVYWENKISSFTCAYIKTKVVKRQKKNSLATCFQSK